MCAVSVPFDDNVARVRGATTIATRVVKPQSTNQSPKRARVARAIFTRTRATRALTHAPTLAFCTPVSTMAADADMSRSIASRASMCAAAAPRVCRHTRTPIARAPPRRRVAHGVYVITDAPRVRRCVVIVCDGVATGDCVQIKR